MGIQTDTYDIIANQPVVIDNVSMFITSIIILLLYNIYVGIIIILI